MSPRDEVLIDPSAPCSSCSHSQAIHGLGACWVRGCMCHGFVALSPSSSEPEGIDWGEIETLRQDYRSRPTHSATRLIAAIDTLRSENEMLKAERDRMMELADKSTRQLATLNSSPVWREHQELKRDLAQSREPGGGKWTTDPITGLRIPPYQEQPRSEQDLSAPPSSEHPEVNHGTECGGPGVCLDCS